MSGDRAVARVLFALWERGVGGSWIEEDGDEPFGSWCICRGCLDRAGVPDEIGLYLVSQEEHGGPITVEKLSDLPDVTKLLASMRGGPEVEVSDVQDVSA